MSYVNITKLNQTWMKVICDEQYMELDVQDRFSFKVANAQFDPRVKAGKWDGIKKLYNRRTHKMHIGLLQELLSFCSKKNWKVNVDPGLLPDEEQLEREDIEHIVQGLIKPHSNGKPIEPYDYQYEAVQYMLNMGRSVSLAATSSGKSMMLYLAVRLYQLMDELNGKTIFITVPSIALVEQLYNDFKDYSTYEGSDWHVSQYCQKISGKYQKFIDKQIVITTWQSMDKLPHDVFEDIGAIFVDEVHTASAKVLGNLIEQAVNTPIKHGVTGTLNGMECDELLVQGLLGPAQRIVTAKEIIDKGRAAKVNVKMTVLEHSLSDRKELESLRKNLRGTKKYDAEVQFINAHRERRELIKGIVDSLPGNTLVLFERVESYGNELYEEYKKLHPDSTFLITGDVDVTDREDIRNAMDAQDNATIWASYGTMSTGVSIKKLHNMVLISSSKSVIRILQSIGRMMRLHDEKSEATIYDIVDDLSIDDDTNYTMKHASERLNFYTQEEFDVDFIKIPI